jgi:NAD+ synthase (glutamine-hydrolysing)
MHRAGQKIRQWRENHQPPLSADEFGRLHGSPEPWPSRTVYGWEAKGKIPRPPVQKHLASLGICDPADWLEPAQPERSAPSVMASQTLTFHAMHRHGFVRVAASTPAVRTADIPFNRDAIIAEARRAHDAHVDLVVYPELCLSSYMLDDLVMQSAFLDRVKTALGEVAEASRALAPVLVIGAPLMTQGQLYNCAVVIAGGEILGVVPKSFLPNYREFYEKRWYSHGRNVKGARSGLAARRCRSAWTCCSRARPFPISASTWKSARTCGARPRHRSKGALAGPRSAPTFRPPTSSSASRTSGTCWPQPFGAHLHGLCLFRRRARREHHRPCLGRAGLDLRTGRPAGRKRALRPPPELCHCRCRHRGHHGRPHRNKTFDDAIEAAGRPLTASASSPSASPAQGDIGLIRPVAPLPLRARPAATSWTRTATRRSTSRSMG